MRYPERCSGYRIERMRAPCAWMEQAMEPVDSKRAKILSKPDLVTAIIVAIVTLAINAALLLILF